MFNNENPYTLRTEVAAGVTHYYVAFKDGQSIRRETAISLPVYLEFQRFIRTERNLRRWDERRVEQAVMTDETLYARAMVEQKSVEDTVFDKLRNEQLLLAIQGLPAIQRRRFILHYEFGLTYGQIAAMENCSVRAVEYSITIAKENFKKYFSK